MLPLRGGFSRGLPRCSFITSAYLLFIILLAFFRGIRQCFLPFLDHNQSIIVQSIMNGAESPPWATPNPSAAPTKLNITESIKEAELAEEEHEFDAISALALNLVIIGCLLLAYFVKKFRIYSLPESAGALIVGMLIGGIVRLTTDNLALFEFVSATSSNLCFEEIVILFTVRLTLVLFLCSRPRYSFSSYYHQSSLKLAIH